MKNVGIALLGAGIAVLAMLLIAPWDRGDAPVEASPRPSGTGVRWDSEIGGYVAGNADQLTIWKVKDGKVVEATTHWLGWDVEVTSAVFQDVRRKGPDGEDLIDRVLITPQSTKRVNFRVATQAAGMAPEGVSVPIPSPNVGSCGACGGASCG